MGRKVYYLRVNKVIYTRKCALFLYIHVKNHDSNSFDTVIQVDGR